MCQKKKTNKHEFFFGEYFVFHYMLQRFVSGCMKAPKFFRQDLRHFKKQNVILNTIPCPAIFKFTVAHTITALMNLISDK